MFHYSSRGVAVEWFNTFHFKRNRQSKLSNEKRIDVLLIESICEDDCYIQNFEKVIGYFCIVNKKLVAIVKVFLLNYVSIV